MLSKENYGAEHIRALSQRWRGVTPSVFEMTMYAFGLLEALRRSGLDFVFKGGTSLLQEGTDFQETIDVYSKAAEGERKLRGLSSLADRDSISDSFLSALSIATFGASKEKKEYESIYKPGIEKLRSHVFFPPWNQETARECAVKAMVAYACLLRKRNFYSFSPIHRNAFKGKPYRSIAKSIYDVDLYDQAMSAVTLFDPAAK